jgi:ABC-type glycerol-3-phosphate transport system substrate-binding protein
LIPIALYNDLRDQLIADLRKGSPFYDAFIFNGQLKSELILCSDCDPEQRPLIAPLTELIRNDPALQWNDVAVFQRTTNSAYDGDIFTVPVDGGKFRNCSESSQLNNTLLDFHYMFYRKDVLDMFGFGVPQTW